MTYTLKSLIDYFNERAGCFESSAAVNAYSGVEDADYDANMYPRLTKEVLRVGNFRAGEKVLDIGCGTGEIAISLASHGIDVRGVDISEGMVKSARAKGINAVQYAGDRLPFPDCHFGHSLIFSVIINLPTSAEAAHLIREAVRVTQGGGHVLVGNIPHPSRFHFPSHDSVQLTWKEQLARSLKLLKEPEIKYFSYPFGFFDQFLETDLVSQIGLIAADADLPVMAGKYHAVLTRRQ